ncbi:ATP-binding protein [Streptomyces sp. NPDC050560]|uniref:ATP-binding protein n=1 Tax=Streptomyces sp. NPDC050560 TaxID=3365630 RepID=UPI00378BF10C
MIHVIDAAADRVEWSFPADPGAVRTARTLVRARLADWGAREIEDVTALLVSELVTNAVRHADGPIRLAVSRTPRRTLLVEVSDQLPDPPRARTAEPDDEGGRGLQLLARSAQRWGTRLAGAGKTVWFELTLPG